MLTPRDTLRLSLDALRGHRLRTALTMLGLAMGVATLITVVTLIQGANAYVETKIANLGTDVFQVARTPFATTDYEEILRALKFKKIDNDDYVAVRELCRDCTMVGATASASTHAKLSETEVDDVNLIGQTLNMEDIDTRTIEGGRYFSNVEEQRATRVCIIGNTLRDRLFGGGDPLGHTIRLASQEFRVIGYYEKLGSVLGQDADNYAVIPMTVFLQIQGARFSQTINVRVPANEAAFVRAQDEVKQILRARRHVAPSQTEDFYIGTKDAYISLWGQISGAFFAVFTLVSAISALVGGIVIMNVMLVSVTERTKEIGLRRAVGASGIDILGQFLTESVLQCLAGGGAGILIGFICAELLRRFTSFPAALRWQVAVMGLVTSSAIGLFFGIYPAQRAAKLDPVEALRSE
jgi:putative ABC transport system permease protein